MINSWCDFMKNDSRMMYALVTENIYLLLFLEYFFGTGRWKKFSQIANSKKQSCFYIYIKKNDINDVIS